MIVYIDNDYKCHVSNDGTMTAVEIAFFDNKCEKFIEGYKFEPTGEKQVSEDGREFFVKMLTPWKDSRELEYAQREYEREQIAEYETLINELYSEVTAE